MKRRNLFMMGGAAGFAAAVGNTASPPEGGPGFSYEPGITVDTPLIAPAGRPIQVAFAINPGVQVIDLAGPWETFQDCFMRLQGAEGPVESPFTLYTVSESNMPLKASGGLQVIPDHTIRTAPQPDVLVIPHFDAPPMQQPDKSSIHEWIKGAHAGTLLTLSICTGAFQLAKTGLLDGLPATTNQRAYDQFARQFPRVDLHRGPRFVETGRIATAGGLSAGIDLALRVVARFYGNAVAARVAQTMEYAGTGWRA